MEVVSAIRDIIKRRNFKLSFDKNDDGSAYSFFVGFAVLSWKIFLAQVEVFSVRNLYRTIVF